MIEDDDRTLGDAVPSSPPPAGPLFVGPPEDPDRYELQDDGTRGGEGRTWRASYRGGLNSPLVEAVKMLFPPAGAGAGWPTEADLRRWHDNAALLRHLAQPHVVQLHDIFGGDLPHPRGASVPGRSAAYLTMEFVEGPTLSSALRGVPVSAGTLATRLEYISHIATAVASLHSHTRSAGNPVLHRDLTPANCIVHATRGIVLIDISGMRLVDDGFDPLGRHTPAYTAPEVLRAPHEPRDPSSDLYAVGAVASFVLTGEDPGGSSLASLLQRAGSANPAAAARHVQSLMDPDPARRPTDVLAWSRTLTTLAAPATRTPRSRRPLLVGAAGVAAVALSLSAAMYALQDSRSSVSLKPDGPWTNNTLGPVLDAASYSPHDFYSTAGRIITPSSGAQIRSCEDFIGVARKLPPGQTLVVSQHNLAEPGSIRFIQVTTDFVHPEKLTTWRSAQFFNPAAINQQVLIELIQMPLTQDLVDADDEQRYDISSALAASNGKVLAAVTITHLNIENSSPTCDVPADT